jgi:hypothetical protein
MPPALAAQFTTGELAVLTIVADEVRERGRCDRTYGELAARAGVCRASARNAVKRAGRLGLLKIEVRLRKGRKHLANMLTIISKEWVSWIERRGPSKPAPVGGKILITTGKEKKTPFFKVEVTRPPDNCIGSPNRRMPLHTR